MKKIVLILAALAGLCLVCSAAPKQKKATSMELKMVCHDGNAITWPFQEPQKTIPGSTTEERVAEFVGKETALTLRGTQYAFKFRPSKFLVKNSKFGLRLGGAKGDYVEVPAVEGMRVSKLALIAGCKNSTCGNPKITTVQGEPIEGGDVWGGTKEMGTEHVWELSGTKAGEPVRMVITNKQSCDIHGIIVTYQIPGKEKKAKKKAK